MSSAGLKLPPIDNRKKYTFKKHILNCHVGLKFDNIKHLIACLNIN